LWGIFHELLACHPALATILLLSLPDATFLSTPISVKLKAKIAGNVLLGYLVRG